MNHLRGFPVITCLIAACFGFNSPARAQSSVTTHNVVIAVEKQTSLTHPDYQQAIIAVINQINTRLMDYLGLRE